ncbi:MAG: HAD hydrolase-like protein [Sphaerochaetaceae bacterium]|nr:HAD hydrolase-like protein [Sphaerochaetaceae bacterium]
MDGTLIDTSEGIFATANHTMKELGYDELPEAQLRKFVGPPLPSCFRLACGLDEDEIVSACDIYRDKYAKGNMFLGQIYPGIESLLETLSSRNLTLAVATLKLEEMAIEILKEKGLYKYFSIIKGADRQGLLTKADIIERALLALKAEDYSKVLMVGDTPHDLDGALSLNIDFIGVDWGFGFHKGHSLEEREHIIGTIEYADELLTYL